MANTSTEKKAKVSITRDVLRGYTHGASYIASRLNKMTKGGAGKKKSRGKKKLRLPPVGGWIGGHPDANGKVLSETYKGQGAMRLSATSNGKRVGGC